MKFLNYTPHIVTLNNGTIYKSLGVARVQSTYTSMDENLICERSFGRVEGLPPPKEGCKYIVSTLVLMALPNRKDLVAPANGHPGSVRDNSTHRLLSVPGFVI